MSLDTETVVATWRNRPRWLLLLIIRWQGFLISLGVLAVAIITLDDWITARVSDGMAWYFGALRPWLHDAVNGLVIFRDSGRHQSAGGPASGQRSKAPLRIRILVCHAL